MLEHRQSDVEKEFEAKLMEELVANVEAEIPEVMFDTQKEENINNFAQRLAQQGIDVDTYLSYMGTDKEAFESSMREQAVSQVKLGLALDKIAEVREDRRQRRGYRGGVQEARRYVRHGSREDQEPYSRGSAQG